MDLGEITDTYSGNLLPSAVRRLLKERDSLGRDDLHGQGIFCSFDDAASHKATALIIGPRDTPYAHGFYFFEVTFPNDYPQRPPRVKFWTGDGRVRFNPNLYVNGKVCLSILGTWPGPRWTELCTLRTTLLSLQSLLCAQPLQNEPGYEDSVGSDCELYSAIIRYENVSIAVLQMLKNTPSLVGHFRKTMELEFLNNFGDLLQALAEFDSCEGRFDRCPVYNFITRYSPGTVRMSLEEIRNSLLEDDELSAERALIGPDREVTGTGTLPARHVAQGLRIRHTICRALQQLLQRCLACILHCIRVLNPRNLCARQQVR